MSQTPLSVSKSLTRRTTSKRKSTIRQDELLNPVNFGSIEDDKKLADWVSETTSTNYRSMIKDEFAALATRRGVR